MPPAAHDLGRTCLQPVCFRLTVVLQTIGSGKQGHNECLEGVRATPVERARREKIGPGQMCFLQPECWAGQAMVEGAACLTSCHWGDCCSCLGQRCAAHAEPPWTVCRQQALMPKELPLRFCTPHHTTMSVLLLSTFLNLPPCQPWPQSCAHANGKGPELCKRLSLAARDELGLTLCFGQACPDPGSCRRGWAALGTCVPAPAH